MTAATKAGVFNRMNWNGFRPQRREGLADSDSSPVLSWVPPSASDSVLTVGNLGSQADAMHAVSADYKRWANRAMNWVRRKGTKVWGNERSEVRPDLDIQLNFVNNVYALPGALAAMEQGVPGRDAR